LIFSVLFVASSIGLTTSSCSTSSNAESSQSTKEQARYDGPRTGVGLVGAPTSEVEWARYGQELLDLAKTYAIENPKPEEVVMWTKPEESLKYRDACVRKQGFSQDGDGTWIGITPEREGAFNLANYVCATAYPSMPKYTAPLDRADIGRAYDWTVHTVIPCLEAKGFTITDVPTREDFISSFGTNPFFPYSQIEQFIGSNTQQAQLEADCPQWPPSEVLYGK
jgi:hypothetical protein